MTSGHDDATRLLADRLVNPPKPDVVYPIATASKRKLVAMETSSRVLPPAPQSLRSWYSGGPNHLSSWLAPQIGMTSDQLEDIRLVRLPTADESVAMSRFFADYGPENVGLWIKRRHARRLQRENGNLVVRLTARGKSVKTYVMAMVPLQVARKFKYPYWKLQGKNVMQKNVEEWVNKACDDE